MSGAATVAAEAAWQSASHRRRRERLVSLALFLLAVALAAWIGEVDPGRLLRGLPMAGDYLWRTVPALSWGSLGTDLAAWMWGLDLWLLLLLDTLLIAYAGTVLGVAAALLLSFTAAVTLAPRGAVGATRRVLEFARTVPALVFALIFVYAFGLGPFAGMLALAVHTMGALGKQFAEVHENAELGPVEAVRAGGGTWTQAMRYGVLPQSLPGLISYALLRFEINIRSASVIGFVGAGGIGEELYHVIAFNYYEEISAIVLLVILAVASIDLVSERLRHRAIGALEGAR